MKKIVGLITILYLISFHVYTYFFFINEKYLPPPYFYFSNDSFMDFFNTGWHAINEGTFDKWFSIYTPLNLYISSVLISDNCLLETSPVFLRECDFDKFLNIVLFILFLLAFIFFLIQLKYKKFSFFSIIFPLSIPLFYAIERGNYLLLCLVFLSLNLIFENRSLKALFYSLAINIKIYLFPILFFSISGIRNKLMIVFLFLSLFTLGIFLYNDPKWYLFFLNLINFSGNVDLVQISWMPSSLIVHKLFLGNIFYYIITLIIYVIIKFSVLLKLFLIFSNLKKIEINENLFITILFLAVSILLNLGYYSFILIFPFLIYLDINKSITNFSFLVICLISAPFGFFKILKIESKTDTSFLYNYFYLTTNFDKDVWILFNSIYIPVLYCILFFNLTTKIDVKEKISC